MRLEVEISDDDLDNLTVFSLKEAYRYNACFNQFDNSDEKIPPDYEFLKAVDHVLDYFLNNYQRIVWEKEKAEIHEQEGTYPPNVEV